MTLRVGSLCSGIGGLDLAVEHVTGGRLVWWSDIAEPAKRVMSARWPDAIDAGDLTAFDWAQLPPVDVLAAGYPCQPFSMAGSRRGTDDARHLWPSILQGVRTIRPRLLVCENVRGHLSLGFDTVLDDLASVGYDADWLCFRASSVGACHRRERLYFIAYPTGEPPRLPHTGPFALPHGRVPDVMGSFPWDEYGPAVEVWERVAGPAPYPAEVTDEGEPIVSPRFVEWMMGFPQGWATDLIESPAHALKALGNAVVPQAAAAALSLLLDRSGGGHE